MNAKLKLNIILILTGILILSLVSCTNPAGPDLSKLQDAVNEEEPIVDAEPETGIVSDPDSGLIAGLSLEGDAILGNADVTVSDGVEWVEGLSGNALRVDRTDDPNGDFLRIDDESGIVPEFTTAGSVEVWVYPETNAPWAGILHKGESTSFTDESWSLQYNGGNVPIFNLNSETTGTSVSSGLVLEVNKWHHLVATWNIDEFGDLTLNFYVDGNLEGTSTVAGFGNVKDSDGDLIVGSQLPVAYNSGYGYISFLGLIDEISLFDRMRSSEEILASYHQYFPAL